ncbi:TOBE domain-containing protein [Oculatella sp. LEGE 06141]|uniref:TOBE domain-containing protein n=1 Tax=Oculatella sp. LEGE 06141 TaxID=1828648 RepID=UPI0018804CEF|nr:TOBE domain-containing protein [Oculatella sp. LEGE 06141]MBE9182778.1 TOBE domain-containing protein [Oculatella sp. LEGE 06141]
MPRKEQGWITFQSSDEERRILEQICQQTQRTKTEVLREMIRQLERSPASAPLPGNTIAVSEDLEEGDVLLSTSIANASINTATVQAVQISARNIVKAKVKRVVKGSVNAEITLTIAPGVELVSIVTRISADKLGLKKGKDVFAVIKSSSVMIAAE